MVVVLCGCSRATPSPTDSVRVAEAVIQRSLDSCYVIEAGPYLTAAKRDSARKAKRLTGRLVDFEGFSLFLPEDVAKPARGASSINLSGWSNCPKCRFGVNVQSDSGIPLEKRIAARVAEQKRIDSVNADPHRTASEFDEMDGPPTPFTGRAGRGYQIDDDCGDCMSISVSFARPSVIATIDYGFDDDISMPWRHRCEMETMARSFAFRD